MFYEDVIIIKIYSMICNLKCSYFIDYKKLDI